MASLPVLRGGAGVDLNKHPSISRSSFNVHSLVPPSGPVNRRHDLTEALQTPRTILLIFLGDAKKMCTYTDTLKLSNLRKRASQPESQTCLRPAMPLWWLSGLPPGAHYPPPCTTAAATATATTTATADVKNTLLHSMIDCLRKPSSKPPQKHIS